MELDKKVISKNRLSFKEMPQMNFNWKLPILVDRDYNVYAGNSLKDSLQERQECIIISVNTYLQECLFNAEQTLAIENSKERYLKAQEEIKKYLKLIEPTVETFSLFTDEEVSDRVTLITEENYKEPAVKHDLHTILDRS